MTRVKTEREKLLEQLLEIPIEEKPQKSMHMERIQIFAPQAEARIKKRNTKAGSKITRY